MKLGLILLLSLTFFSCSKKEFFKFKVDKENNKIDVYYGDDYFTSFFEPENVEKPILYPIFADKDICITRKWPLRKGSFERVDHPHQVGLWFNFGDVNGYDFWNNSSSIPEDKKKYYGSVILDRITGFSEGDTSSLSFKAYWITEIGDTLLTENSTFNFFIFNGSKVIQRLINIEAYNDTVKFFDNKEGLFGIRMAREFEEYSEEPLKLTNENGAIVDTPFVHNENVKGHFISSENLSDREAWGRKADWVILTSEVKGIPVSVSIFNNPNNPGYKPVWHTRHYGLFAVNNFGSKSFREDNNEVFHSLLKGESYNFNYAVVISSGKPFTENDAKIFMNLFKN